MWKLGVVLVHVEGDQRLKRADGKSKKGRFLTRATANEFLGQLGRSRLRTVRPERAT